MISLLALIPGLGLPALAGWLLLRVIEGHHPVLLRSERWMLGVMVGLAYGTFAVFLANVALGVPLTRLGFLGVFAIASVLLLLLFFRQRLPLRLPPVRLAPSPPLSSGAKIVWGILTGWIALRIVMLAIDFLLLSPTSLDDTLDNWNLRGKVFYVTRTLTLVLPNEDAVTSPQGISSYPPALPLMKTWLAALAGNWSEPLVNSIHVLWYVAALVLLYATLRRRVSVGWSLLGVYLLGSLPLFLMHGTNTYADALLAAHVFAAVTLLFHAFAADDERTRWTFLKLAAIAAAILPFIKNEGLLVYLPPLLVLFCWQLLRGVRSHAMNRAAVQRGLVLFALVLLAVVGPYLAFKLGNGMTFGNAKPFTTLGIGWQKNVLHAIFINTLFEGNWLLLFPLFLLLLVWCWRLAFTRFGLLTFFFLIVYVGQAGLYLFTGLSTEALRQTGYARGLIHIVPIAVLLTTLLLHEVTAALLAPSHKHHAS